MSPSARKYKLRVWCRMPGMSEAINDSPSPTPMTTGGPERAATILSGSAAERIPSANAPVSRFTATRTACSRQMGAPCACGVLLHLLDEVGDDLGVGLGDELVALGDELALQIEIVFDNAVVHHHDAARAVAVRMGVLLGGAAVRSPARVADAERATERVLAQDFFQVAQLAGRAPHRQLVARGTAYGDSGRIISAVFEPPQSLDDDRDHLLGSDISDNAAHATILWDPLPASL